LALAQEALWQLDLDEVILVPTGQAPHKRIADDPGRELRLAMTRLAAADDSRFSASTLEVEREGPSYTYETLELLAKDRGDRELVFVMGADDHNAPGNANAPEALRAKMGHNAELAKALAAKMPHGRAEVIPDTGHLVFLEAPARYNELLLGFLGTG